MIPVMVKRKARNCPLQLNWFCNNQIQKEGSVAIRIKHTRYGYFWIKFYEILYMFFLMRQTLLSPYCSINYYPNFPAKSLMASEILICWGQTASQLLQPIQAAGRFSSGTAIIAMGAINPPSVKQCSLYKFRRDGISSPLGQWLVQ